MLDEIVQTRRNTKTNPASAHPPFGMTAGAEGSDEGGLAFQMADWRVSIRQNLTFN